MSVFTNAVQMAPYRALIWLDLLMLETTSANTLVEERCPESLRPTRLASPHSIKLMAYLLGSPYMQRIRVEACIWKFPFGRLPCVRNLHCMLAPNMILVLI